MFSKSYSNLEEPILATDFDLATLEDELEYQAVGEGSYDTAPVQGTEESSESSHGEGRVRLNHATTTLAATIVGAGIMALPRAFAVLGLGVGSIIFAMVFFLSEFSLSALVHAANATGCFSYSGLVEKQFGNVGSKALQISILLNNSGAMIIYLILIADVLCGVAPNYSGLVTNLFGIHDPSVIWVGRPFVMGIVCVFLLSPLLSLRNLGLLGPMSTVSVGVASAFALTIVGLAVAAGVQGKLAPDFTWLPSPEALGAPSLFRMIVTFIATLPVIAMSLICHFNLLPLVSDINLWTITL